MKMLRLAAGFAAGYVLGARAGREKYEQIAATARKVRANPSVIQAQEKAKSLLGTSAGTGGSGSGVSTPAEQPGLPEKNRKPRPPRTEPVSVSTPATTGTPLA